MGKNANPKYAASKYIHVFCESTDLFPFQR